MYFLTDQNARVRYILTPTEMSLVCININIFSFILFYFKFIFKFIGVSVNILCFSFWTFTMHTGFWCRQLSYLQDVELTISSNVSSKYRFNTQKLDAILSLLQVQPYHIPLLEFISSMNYDNIEHCLPKDNDWWKPF